MFLGNNPFRVGYFNNDKDFVKLEDALGDIEM